jgi:RNA polymerase sigma-70 factor (ECF subfamily)
MKMPARPDIARLYDEHAQPLFAFLLNLTRDEADTRDLLQEMFVKLARDANLLQGVREERAFFIRLAHNAAIDLMRRRGTRERTKENFAEILSPFAAAADPDEATFRAELAAALAELPPEQRAVAHLKLWTGLTFEEIASALDIPPNTAASRYRYALDKMRDRLRPLYEEIK